MIDAMNPYFKQVQLLVRLLPHIREVDCFALKGGTAINLFVRDVPRLSVDIDLVYVPIEERALSLERMTAGFRFISKSIKKVIGAVVKEQIDSDGIVTKLIVTLGREIVKIEASPVGRGLLRSPIIMPVSDIAEKIFGHAALPVVCFDELYAGKICAALDRQHPRDLFDIKILLEN